MGEEISSTIFAAGLIILSQPVKNLCLLARNVLYASLSLAPGRLQTLPTVTV